MHDFNLNAGSASSPDFLKGLERFRAPGCLTWRGGCGYNSHMKSVSVSEAKAHLSRILGWVRAGETVYILDRGVPVARLEAVGGKCPEALKVLERSGLVRRGSGCRRLRASPVPVEGSVLELLLEERREGR